MKGNRMKEMIKTLCKRYGLSLTNKDHITIESGTVKFKVK